MPHAGQTGTVNEISKKVRQCLGSSAWVASCLPPADAVKRKEEAGGEGGLFLSPSPAGSDFLSAGITSGPQVRRDPAATGWPVGWFCFFCLFHHSCCVSARNSSTLAVNW